MAGRPREPEEANGKALVKARPVLSPPRLALHIIAKTDLPAASAFLEFSRDRGSLYGIIRYL